MEENRPRWGGRTSNPVGAAGLSRVGSTPILFRHSPVNDRDHLLKLLILISVLFGYLVNDRCPL